MPPIEVWIVDDDDAVRDSLSALLKAEGYAVAGFADPRAFLDFAYPGMDGCLISDVRMPGMTGLEMLKVLLERRIEPATIFITGHGDIPMAVQAVKSGASDFIEKPFPNHVLLEAVEQACARKRSPVGTDRLPGLRARHATLTERERQVMDLVVSGLSNKEIGLKLGISPRTVDIHRTHVMEKMKADSLPDLVRQAILLE